ncbi:MAG: DUF4292 domain-containing protein [Bacteroidales bacterium]|nr:DUF4292 domain-containing protein [Bacteroidales bacterium]
MKKTNIFIILTLLFSSCGIFKKSVQPEDKYDNSFIEKIKVQTALDSIQKHYPKIETFYCGFTGNYEKKDQKLPLKGLIKIKTDEFIWISVRPVMGIEISRILITQDSIKVIDKIKNEYFAENINYLKSKVGFELNYETIQAIFLNRFFIFPPENKIESYFLINVENNKTLSATGIFSGMNISHNTIFSENNFIIYENNLKLFNKNQSLNIAYSNFQPLNKKEFPNTIQIIIKDAVNLSMFNISYKNIKINETIKASFKIPENFKRVKFE